MAGMEYQKDIIGIGEIHHLLQLRLALHQRPAVRMEAELDARVHGALAGLIQSSSESLRVFVGEILRAVTHAPAEVDLEVLAAEIRNVARSSGIVLDGLRNPGGVQILAAPPHSRE